MTTARCLQKVQLSVPSDTLYSDIAISPISNSLKAHISYIATNKFFVYFFQKKYIASLARCSNYEQSELTWIKVEISNLMLPQGALCGIVIGCRRSIKASRGRRSNYVRQIGHGKVVVQISSKYLVRQ